MTVISLASYQNNLVDGISSEIEKSSAAACVLLAPTGAGKTLVLGRSLSDAGTRGLMAPTVWLWVAPLEVIVEQTGDALRDEAGPMVQPRDLAKERSISNHAPGDVWMTTTAYLTNSRSNLQDDTERSVSLPTFVASVRAQGFQVGLVVDEAHIAADSTTRFGEVIRHVVRPDLVITATATPKDERLEAFLMSIGQSRRRNFSVTRGDVVREYLNKESLRVLRLVGDKQRASIDHNSLLDLLVKRAWTYNQEKADALVRNSIGITPLMLVQVENGSDEGRAMQERIMRLCNLSADEVALYFDNEKSHGSLRDIARNPKIKALVFKVAAGTGFDAPRAFVLASTRSSQDSNAALQFIGRIMRVDREIRPHLYGNDLTKEDRDILNSGRLVVLDDTSQVGFKKAADLIKGMRRDIDPDVQSILIESEFLEYEDEDSAALEAMPLMTRGEGTDDLNVSASTPCVSAKGNKLDAFHIQQVTEAKAKIVVVEKRGPSSDRYASFEDLQADLHQQGLEAVRLSSSVPSYFTREDWPSIASSQSMVQQLATAILPNLETIARLIPKAIGTLNVQVSDSYMLGSGKTANEIEKITNENFAAEDAKRLANHTMDRLLGFEDRALRQSLVSAVMADVRHKGGVLLPSLSAARPLANLLIAEGLDALVQEQSRAMIGQALSVRADNLPQILIVPLGMGSSSSKSAYDLIPGSKDEFDELDEDVRLSMQAWKTTVVVVGRNGVDRFNLTPIDQTWAINETERSMIDMLERHDDVTWWLRNPSKKPYAVAVLKLDGKKGFFYPDFVIGTSWGGESRQQLVETKYDVSDIEAKMKRGKTIDYGRVIFARLMQGQLYVVKNDGTAGSILSPDSINALTDQMRQAFLA